jgi:uncharacterized protein YndB with AHSA1/START domain
VTDNIDSERPAVKHLSFEVEAEVPGTPEQIWQAIATGPGVTLWFTRMEIEERLGGRVVADPNQPVAAKVTVWEPPHRFAYEYPESAGPHAWEYTIEAREGGSCTVRLVDSCFVKAGDFAGEIPTGPEGWKWAFDLLIQNQTYFPGQLGASVQAMWPVPGTFSESLATFRDALGLPDPRPGEEIAALAPGAPTLAGRTISFDGRVMIILLEQPGPGLAWLGTGGASEQQSHAMVHINLFGPGAAEVAAREEPRWFAWLAQTYPMPEARPEPAAADA